MISPAHKWGGAVRFRVLGSTAIMASDGPTPIPSERQRRLLAALAIRSPDAVSADRLIEACSTQA